VRLQRDGALALVKSGEQGLKLGAYLGMAVSGIMALISVGLLLSWAGALGRGGR
jgi:hypothetical protein